jgi:hypothetical protein
MGYRAADAGVENPDLGGMEYPFAHPAYAAGLAKAIR